MEIRDLKLGRRTTIVGTWIETKPGAVGATFSPRPTTPPLVMIYKVMGKMFAILSVRGTENVILKCDPYLATMLRKEYTGIGHRSHLDRRYWISVDLNADVPIQEIKRLVSQSYELVCAKLSGKQRTELAGVASEKSGIAKEARARRQGA